ncbi:MAG: hypothetical protein ACK4NE_00125 [Albidovulum sp.]
MAGGNEQLIVNLGARMTDLERQMKRAGQLADGAVRGIEDRFERANPKLGGLGNLITGVAGGILGADAIGRLIQGFRDANKELIVLGDTAKLTGQSIEELSRIQAAGRTQGVSAQDINSGVRGIAEKLNEARREENDLTKLLEANNIKYKDREGNVIGVNRALEIAATLIQNAATELDKVTIAKQLGLSEQWIKVLEGGPEAFRQMQSAAEAAGATISRETVDKAREFEKAWADAWESFATNSKAVLNDVTTAFGFLIGQAATFLQGLKDLQSYQVTATRGGIRGPVIPGVTDADGNLLGQGNQLYNEPIGPTRPMGYVPPSTRTGRTTVIPSRRSGGSGGGEETTDADKAQARLERYIETLMRQEAVEKAIADTVGQSRAVQQAAIEIAKAQVDLAKLDEETRRKITEQLTAQVKKLEEQRQATERLKQVQQSYNQLLTFAGNSAIDALDRMIVGGQSFGQVVGDLTRQLARMLLQASLLGQGPLAALFGLQGAGGGVGGICSAIFGGFRGGGPVSSGRSYVVGENGPELFRPSVSGMIVPNSVASRGGGGVAVSFGDTVIDARGSQMSEGQMRAILAEQQARTLALVPDAVKRAQQNRRL